MSENNMDLPGISVVIIGLNSEKFLKDCINSVLAADYPDELIEIFYVDGGSSDSSVSIARDYYRTVKIVELNDPYPSPGKGRNAGYKVCNHGLVQFLDSDSYVDSEWFRNALKHLSGNVGAVCGGLFERFPEKNWYHRMANYDWGVVSGVKGWLYESGETTGFGGNALVLKEALEQTGGYDIELIAGEEADLSYRIREKGWKILRINESMASHDINLKSFKVYTKRAYRSGYGYGQIGTRYAKSSNKTYLKRIFRILFSGLFPLGMFLLGILLGYLPFFIVLALLSLLRPFYKVPLFIKRYGMGWESALGYGAHLSYVVIPQFFGMIRFFYGKITNNPMRNKR